MMGRGMYSVQRILLADWQGAHPAMVVESSALVSVRLSAA